VMIGRLEQEILLLSVGLKGLVPQILLLF
jgi:hypothetical protein